MPPKVSELPDSLTCEEVGPKERRHDAAAIWGSFDHNGKVKNLQQIDEILIIAALFLLRSGYI